MGPIVIPSIGSPGEPVTNGAFDLFTPPEGVKIVSYPASEALSPGYAVELFAGRVRRFASGPFVGVVLDVPGRHGLAYDVADMVPLVRRGVVLAACTATGDVGAADPVGIVASGADVGKLTNTTGAGVVALAHSSFMGSAADVMNGGKLAVLSLNY